VFEGRNFVTSPNKKHIYAPPASKRMTFKTDYRLGEHDPLLWPQPYLEPQCHLACIPRRVEVFEESTRPIFKILFHQVGSPDFWPLANGPISGLGFLQPHRLTGWLSFSRPTQLPIMNSAILFLDYTHSVVCFSFQSCSFSCRPPGLTECLVILLFHRPHFG
jgi:hypothetical protein